MRSISNVLVLTYGYTQCSLSQAVSGDCKGRAKFPKLEKRLSEMNFSLHSEWLCYHFPGEVARHLIDLHVRKILQAFILRCSAPSPLTRPGPQLRVVEAASNFLYVHIGKIFQEDYLYLSSPRESSGISCLSDSQLSTTVLTGGRQEGGHVRAGSRPGSHHLCTAVSLPPSLSSRWNMRDFISAVTMFCCSWPLYSSSHPVCFKNIFFQGLFSVSMWFIWCERKKNVYI